MSVSRAMSRFPNVNRHSLRHEATTDSRPESSGLRHTRGDQSETRADSSAYAGEPSTRPSYGQRSPTATRRLPRTHDSPRSGRIPAHRAQHLLRAHQTIRRQPRQRRRPRSQDRRPHHDPPQQPRNVAQCQPHLNPQPAHVAHCSPAASSYVLACGSGRSNLPPSALRTRSADIRSGTPDPTCHTPNRSSSEDQP